MKEFQCGVAAVWQRVIGFHSVAVIIQGQAVAGKAAAAAAFANSVELID